MPTYEYECAKCGGTLEKFQSMTEKPLKKCPSCGGSTLKRLIGAGAGIIFKGSGFYQTDYRSESYKKKQKEDTCSNPGSKPACGAGKSCPAD
ncbi:MAG: zinc ribbon domain-containing protein [Candidatus Omnitrophica bacterium]|nr:zinc ribbon domain-containing protein [Candidatus Omnitrophota bacterium]